MSTESETEDRRGISIRARLFLLVALFVAGFTAFGGAVLWTFQRVKVNGPVYGEIIQLKDLVADFLPPPEYIVETHMNSYQMASMTGRGDVGPLVAIARRLRKEHEERHKVWVASLPEGRMRELATTEAYEAAVGYFAALEDKLVPVAQSGDQASARKVCDEVLEPLYQKHRKAVDELIALTNAKVAETEKSTSEYITARLWMVSLLGTLIVVAVTALSFIVVRAVTRPLAMTTDVLDTVATGDLSARLELDSEDEFGQMGRSLNKALTLMSSTVRTISDNAQTLAGSSEELSAIGRQMASTAEETSAQAGVVSNSSGQVNSNVQTVTAAVEEMGATIREIAKHSGEAAKVASNAVDLASATNATVAQLGRSSDEIGSVVKVITSIAEQTNLLALNATIEAARAGEAGKGFAVVANEVKELAKQTARATEEIGRKVQAIQADTSAAVGAIDQVGRIIAEISSLQSTIASAVEEQTAATNEIIRNVNQAARGMGEITSNIESVAMAARETSEAAGQMQTASGDLSQMATGLNALVAQFICGPRPGSDHYDEAPPHHAAGPRSMPRPHVSSSENGYGSGRWDATQTQSRRRPLTKTKR